jgi:hypothetical protein
MRLVRFGLFLWILALVASACTHSVSPITPKPADTTHTDTTVHKDTTTLPDTTKLINRLDTTHFSTIIITIQGAFGLVHYHTSWSSPSGTETSTTDTTYLTAIPEEFGYLASAPVTFIRDTLNIGEAIPSSEPPGWDSICIVIDSSHTRFLVVNDGSNSGQYTSMLLFSGSWGSYSIGSMPFTQSADGSLVAHVPGCSLLKWMSNSWNHSHGNGDTKDTTSLISIDSLAPNAYTEIDVKP